MIGTVLSSGCTTKPIYVQQPFLGFSTYELPKDVTVEVERSCIAKYKVGDYDSLVNVGDCVRIEDVKKLTTKIKILEGIAKNYKLDIEAYNRIHQPKKNILWRYR